LDKTWQFPSLFSEVPRFCFYLLKVEGTVENFKNPQQSSSIFAFSIHTTFSQTQTGVTFPLKQGVEVLKSKKYK
jgi:hypothetical protein